MKASLLPALVIAAGLALGGFLAGGRYTIVRGDSNTVARLDRFTGEVSMCVVGVSGENCGFVIDPESPK